MASPTKQSGLVGKLFSIPDDNEARARHVARWGGPSAPPKTPPRVRSMPILEDPHSSSDQNTKKKSPWVGAAAGGGKASEVQAGMKRILNAAKDVMTKDRHADEQNMKPKISKEKTKKIQDLIDTYDPVTLSDSKRYNPQRFEVQPNPAIISHSESSYHRQPLYNTQSPNAPASPGEYQGVQSSRTSPLPPKPVFPYQTSEQWPSDQPEVNSSPIKEKLLKPDTSIEGRFTASQFQQKRLSSRPQLQVAMDEKVQSDKQLDRSNINNTQDKSSSRPPSPLLGLSLPTKRDQVTSVTPLPNVFPQTPSALTSEGGRRGPSGIGLGYPGSKPIKRNAENLSLPYSLVEQTESQAQQDKMSDQSLREADLSTSLTFRPCTPTMSPPRDTSTPAAKPKPMAKARSGVDLSRTFAKVQRAAANIPPPDPTPLHISSPKQKLEGHARTRSEFSPRAGSPLRHDTGNVGYTSQSVVSSGRSRAKTLGSDDLEKDFERLMDAMQIPKSVRSKMATLEPAVKLSMLRSSSQQSTQSLHSKHSTISLIPPRSTTPETRFSTTPSSSLADLTTDADWEMVSPPPKRLRSRSSFASISNIARPKSSKGTGTDSVLYDDKSPAFFAIMMKVKSLQKIEPAEVRKLRVLLRNESPNWIEEWILLGGYGGLLGKLKEILELEWREEQHDDQVLHEIEKCLKALLDTKIGRTTLALHSPSPFVQLVSLLLSEKKPGDLPIRQIIIDLTLGLFEIFPFGSNTLNAEDWKLPIQLTPNHRDGIDDNTEIVVSPLVGGGYSPSGSPNRSTFKHQGSPTPPMAVPARSAHGLVRSLVIGPPDPKEEAIPEFMQDVHRPRIYKRWLSELIGVLMDYFWVFCHSQNTFGDLKQLNQDQMEGPRVPGGMTGGVEFEAMAYCATHLRLINKLGRTCPSETDAYRFHFDLFESGFEKILMTLRKCSTTYYPQVHLELARYIDLARKAHYDLPAVVIEKCEGVSHVERRIAAAKIQQREARQSHPRSHPTLPPLSFD